MKTGWGLQRCQEGERRRKWADSSAATVFLEAFLVWCAGKGLEIQALPAWGIAALWERHQQRFWWPHRTGLERQNYSQLSFLLKTVAESWSRTGWRVQRPIKKPLDGRRDVQRSWCWEDKDEHSRPALGGRKRWGQSESLGGPSLGNRSNAGEV